MAVGRWHALFEGNWRDALPYLAKGTDVKWKAAIEREMNSPKMAAEQVALADAWWDIAQAGPGDDNAHGHLVNR